MFGNSTNGDGIPDGYSPEAYDTQLAVSAANVLLSGAARFDYFNTIRENRGSFTLRNKNHFDTIGGLVNKGAIRVEAESRLNVFGELVVDEGMVFVDSSSILDVKSPNTLEVIGGNVTVQRGAAPIGVGSRWIVREKWVGVDELGNDIVLEGRVSFGDAWFPTIGPNADILLEGKRAVFEPLSRLNRIQGKLTLTGGNELHLAQSLTNEGTLKLAKAGKLYVDGNLTNSGELLVGSDAFLDVTGAFTATAGSIQLDGVVHTASLAVSAGAATEEATPLALRDSAIIGRSGLPTLKATSMTGVTQILARIESGDTTVAEQLLPLVDDELRRLAAHRLAQEKPGQTLQATALVHEATSDWSTAIKGRAAIAPIDDASLCLRRKSILFDTIAA